MTTGIAKPVVCVVDDDSLVRESVQGLLRGDGFQVAAFESAERFLDRLVGEPPACLILDLSLPGMSGLDLHDELVRGGIDVPTMLLTAHADVPITVRAMKAGFVELFTKPFDDGDLIAAVRRTVAPRRTTSAESAVRMGGIVGQSRALVSVLRQVELVADTDATVLITGESGTGKDLVARAIHENSRRRNEPLVRVNCGAIPESLFESELFGHVRGAFTGALADRMGRFGAAHGGTLMLDEIGEVPLSMQPKLLHVIQEKEFERLGETRARKIDVRIIAATNRDLASEVEAGRFRRDLFYRLNVFPIESPPLRDRREDIPLLAEHFVRASARRLHREPPPVTEAALRHLMSREWPGNIRELENTIERALILARGGPLRFESEPAVVPLRPGQSSPLPLLSPAAMEKHQRDAIVAALERSGGRVSGPRGAAEMLGMKASTLFSRMTVLGLRQVRKNRFNAVERRM
jgi:DNA-binding NtrC family response regulator